MNEPIPAEPKERDPSNQIAELGAYLTSYLEAQRDRIKLGLRDALWGLGLLPLLLLFVSGVVLTGIVFFLYGAALGLGKVLEGHEWLGFLVLGGGLILVTGMVLLYLFSQQRRRSLRRQIKQYERELAQQREEFGHDAEERARQY